MKRPAIDFAPPSLARGWHRAGGAGWALLALGVLLGAAAIAVSVHMAARQNALDQQAGARQSAQLRSQRSAAAVAATPVVGATAALNKAEAAAINSAILQLNLPWPALREAVGAATPPAVALLSLEPDARKGSLKITAETVDAQAMVDYIASLKRQPLMGDVVLLRHEVNELDPNRPLRFELDAPWRKP